MKVKINCFI